MQGDVAVGELVVGVPLSFLRQLLEEITFDTGIVLLVGLLVAFELLLLVVSTNLTFPLGLVRQLMADIREGRVVRVVAVPVRNEVGRLLTELNRAVRLDRRQAGRAAPQPMRRPQRRSSSAPIWWSCASWPFSSSSRRSWRDPSCRSSSRAWRRAPSGFSPSRS